MKILRVRIRNINSLRGDHLIDFTEPPLSTTGIFAITGDTGAGKTTILDAITLALYGQIARNQREEEAMTYDTGEMMAEVEFQTLTGLYRATYSRHRAYGRPDGNMQAATRILAHYDAQQDEWLNLTDKITETREEIPRVTGLDFDRFTRSVMLSQGEFAAFLRARDAERGDLLESITGTTIYTELSRAAFNRHKQEREHLADLRRQQDQLQLLTDEEVAEMQQALTESRKRSRELKDRLSAQRQIVDAFATDERLSRRQQELQAEIRTLQQQLEDRQDDRRRLMTSQQLRQFAPALQRLRDGRQQIRQLETEKEKRAADLNRFAENRATAAAEEKKVQQQLEEAEAAAEKQQPLLEEVDRLDTRIGTLNDQLTEKNNRLKQLQQRRDNRQKALQQSVADLRTVDSRMKEDQAWLTRHAIYRDLSARLAGWREKYRQLEEKQRDLKAGTESLLQLNKDLQNVNDKLGKVRGEQEELNDGNGDRLRRIGQWLDTAPGENWEDLDEALTGLIEEQREYDRLHKQREGLQQEYRKVAGQLQELEDELEELSTREQQLLPHLLEVTDALEEAIAGEAGRFAILRQQQLLSDHESVRRELQPGEPCPICLSTEHPFREKMPEPQVNMAREDHLKAKEEVSRLRDKRQELSRQEQDILVQRRKIMGSQRDPLREQLQILEDQLASLQLPAAATSARPTVEELERERVALRGWARRRAEKREQHIRLLAKQEQLTARLEAATGQQARLEEQARALATDLTDKLRAFYPDIVPDQIRGRLQELERLTSEVSSREDTLDKDAHRKAELVTSGKHLQEEVNQLEEQLAADSQALAEQQEQLSLLQNKRKELFGEGNTTTERQRLREKMQSGRRNLEAARRELNRWTQEERSTGRLLEEKGNELQQLQQSLGQQVVALSAALARLGLGTPEEADARLLPAAEEEKLDVFFRRMDEQLGTNRKLLQDLQRDLEKNRQQLPADTDAQQARQALSGLEDEWQKQERESGRLQGELDTEEKKQAMASDLLNRIRQQDRELLRWTELNELIGSADGKKFRTFAQGLTLRNLVRLANRHLQNLHGRYLIRKKEDEDLGLEIVDTYQADNVRSMNTLSGGESFLVSLALALGLSDLAGRDTQIESLFIDEGFGTLDESSLDMALTTLENLKARGKVIGVISHVRALKERVGTQVRLLRGSNGYSRLELQG